jgi:hypothetical protein
MHKTRNSLHLFYSVINDIPLRSSVEVDINKYQSEASCFPEGMDPMESYASQVDKV